MKRTHAQSALAVFLFCSYFRSECEGRPNDVTGEQPTLRMLAMDCGRLFELPKVPNNFCLIHNGGIECTCSEHLHGHTRSRPHTKPNCTQVLQVLGSEAEREKCRTRLVESVIDRHKSSSQQQKVENPKQTEEKTSRPSKERKSERNRGKAEGTRATNSSYVRTWLAAGADVPRFIKEPFLARK